MLQGGRWRASVVDAHSVVLLADRPEGRAGERGGTREAVYRPSKLVRSTSTRPPPLAVRRGGGPVRGGGVGGRLPRLARAAVD